MLTPIRTTSLKVLLLVFRPFVCLPIGSPNDLESTPTFPHFVVYFININSNMNSLEWMSKVFPMGNESIPLSGCGYSCWFSVLGFNFFSPPERWVIFQDERLFVTRDPKNIGLFLFLSCLLFHKKKTVLLSVSKIKEVGTSLNISLVTHYMLITETLTKFLGP